MKYKAFADTIAVRLDVGDEIAEAVASVCAQENVKAAEVTAIGAVSRAVTGVLDLERREYNDNVYEEFMELVSLSGSVSEMHGEAYVHLHAAFARSGGALVGGHLKSAVVAATCELFIRRLDGRLSRRVCEKTGLNIFDL